MKTHSNGRTQQHSPSIWDIPTFALAVHPIDIPTASTYAARASSLPLSATDRDEAQITIIPATPVSGMKMLQGIQTTTYSSSVGTISAVSSSGHSSTLVPLPASAFITSTCSGVIAARSNVVLPNTTA